MTKRHMQRTSSDTLASFSANDLLGTTVLRAHTPINPLQQIFPRTEAEVPRVSLEEAMAALDSGAAVIVDVRSPDAYEQVILPVQSPFRWREIEINPTGLTLDKDQWIITYCT